MISIHAPREGRDNKTHKRKQETDKFQSTRPARGATSETDPKRVGYHFNPRAPRGARRWISENQAESVYISIHAPREVRDCFDGSHKIS